MLLLGSGRTGLTGYGTSRTRPRPCSPVSPGSTRGGPRCGGIRDVERTHVRNVRLPGMSSIFVTYGGVPLPTPARGPAVRTERTIMSTDAPLIEAPRKNRLLLILGGVLALALVAGGIYAVVGKDDDTGTTTVHRRHRRVRSPTGSRSRRRPRTRASRSSW